MRMLRRSLRRAAVAAALALPPLAACGGDGGGRVVGPPLYAPILIGGDISAVTRLEQAGAVYRQGAGTVDAITALRTAGSNIFRLRLFVAPDGSEVQVNDLAYTIALAQRVKASGAALMLDFHYSDTWADPGKQYVPAAWAALGIDSLEATLQRYTAAVLDTMRANGVLPRYVQVGNEVDNGLCWPLGRINAPGSDDAAAYQRFGRLLRAGVRGVRAATTAADSVRIIMHYSSGATPGAVQWFYDLLGAQAVDYDVIGLSYYPWWHGRMSGLQQAMTLAATRYGKPIMVVETAYPWRAGWAPSGRIADAMQWPETAEGQSAFVRDLIASVRAVPNGLGQGILWWYPEAVDVPGFPVWGGGTLALFDATGYPLPAASLFRFETGAP